MPFEPPTCCEVTFPVCGTVMKRGNAPIEVDGLTISVELEGDFPHSYPQPNFYLNVGTMELPWVLAEPMEEVVSTANDPAFMEKMVNKLLERL